jgi:hypothetical protein
LRGGAAGELLQLVTREERRRIQLRTNGTRWLTRTKALFAQVESDTPAARMYYMSVPPFLYAQICSALDAVRNEDAFRGGPSEQVRPP